MSWKTSTAAWRERISLLCQTQTVRSLTASLGIFVVLATPLAISWWFGGKHVQASFAEGLAATQNQEVKFELPLPTDYRDELRAPGDETKSGYIYLDLIQRLEMISADLEKCDFTSEAAAINDITQNLCEKANKSPWKVKNPVYDDRYIFPFSLGYDR